MQPLANSLNESLTILSSKEWKVIIHNLPFLFSLSTEILKRIKNGKLICVDQDEEALSVARDRLLKISDNVLFYKRILKILKKY